MHFKKKFCVCLQVQYINEQGFPAFCSSQKEYIFFIYSTYLVQKVFCSDFSGRNLIWNSLSFDSVAHQNDRQFTVFLDRIT